MPRIPKVIPPRSRVRLIRADDQTPSWKKDIGREFRVGYYSRKDGLDCIWLVNEEGEYEQTTDRKFLLKYFDVEHWSREKDFFGRGRRRLRRIRIPSPLERLVPGSLSRCKRDLAKGRSRHATVRRPHATPRPESFEQGRGGLRLDADTRKIRDSGA
jgi:hypothetical protein